MVRGARIGLWETLHCTIVTYYFVDLYLNPSFRETYEKYDESVKKVSYKEKKLERSLVIYSLL